PAELRAREVTLIAKRVVERRQWEYSLPAFHDIRQIRQQRAVPVHLHILESVKHKVLRGRHPLRHILLRYGRGGGGMKSLLSIYVGKEKVFQLFRRHRYLLGQYLNY